MPAFCNIKVPRFRHRPTRRQRVQQALTLGANRASDWLCCLFRLLVCLVSAHYLVLKKCLGYSLVRQRLSQREWAAKLSTASIGGDEAVVAAYFGAIARTLHCAAVPELVELCSTFLREEYLYIRGRGTEFVDRPVCCHLVKMSQYGGFDNWSYGMPIPSHGDRIYEWTLDLLYDQSPSSKPRSFGRQFGAAKIGIASLLSRNGDIVLSEAKPFYLYNLLDQTKESHLGLTPVADAKMLNIAQSGYVCRLQIRLDLKQKSLDIVQRAQAKDDDDQLESIRVRFEEIAKATAVTYRLAISLCNDSVSVRIRRFSMFHL